MSKPISCLIVDDEAIAREIIATHLSKISNIEIVKSCSNAIEAFNCISNNKIDLVFLDINMPEIQMRSPSSSVASWLVQVAIFPERDPSADGVFTTVSLHLHHVLEK